MTDRLQEIKTWIETYMFDGNKYHHRKQDLWMKELYEEVGRLRKENGALREFIQAIDLITQHHSNPLPSIYKMLDSYFDRKIGGNADDQPRD